ncbi:MAG: pilus (MSHA type) biogenesis protein MshL [Desulfuromonadales bacterium C00003096]|jgi:MSHA type pilus biogenesis protein MshL|nr:MAG: pilus (MSHA type) biogenesis protein MshL [Desulfuromonadales bacterium C00003096]OEU80785.1 MAG: pilus (MSHA type) biogenesis protein MshL [Desulfobacterales bacterium S5133MH4]
MNSEPVNAYKRAGCLPIVVAFLFLSGCALGPTSVLDSKRPSPDSFLNQIEAESDELGAEQKELRDRLEKEAFREVEAEPVMPAYDPFEDQIVSFSMVDEDLQLVLYSLSQAVGMNIILDPNLSDEKLTVTLNFDNASASTVLKEILSTFDLCYEVEQNIIRIKPYEERMFRLNFLDTNVNTTFDVGGDVLGAGDTSASGLSGNFKLSGRGARKGNPYDLLDEMIRRMLSDKGKYSLNRLSGTLYVKDTPSVIRSVSRLINHLRDMLARQIHIEARIIEVSLSDKYIYGIDWGILRDQASTSSKLNSAEWALGSGLVLSGVNRNFSVDATIKALRTFGDAKVVSNPSIRCKHSQPAIISVGTSHTYKKSVTTSNIDHDYGLEQTTQVEVSTVFDGLILGVIPFIEEDGDITLLINPIKSDVDPISIEPVPVNSKATDSISLPQVSIKEISTTIGIRSGDLVILGGLIDKRRQTEKKGVPFLSAMPWLGYLFKDESSRDETRELVIILSVSII